MSDVSPGPTGPTRPAAPGGHRPAWLGLALLCVTGVVWGTIGPVVGVLERRSALSVLVVGAHRGVWAVAALALVVSAARRWPACRDLARAEGGRVVATGVLTAVFQLLFFVAVVEAGVSVTTVVALGFAPVLLLVLGALRDRRAPAVAEVLTVATAVLGLLLVSTGGVGSGSAPHPAWGVLLALGSGAAYAVAADVGGPLARGHDALAVTTCTTGVVAVVLVAAGVLAAATTDTPLTTGDPLSWGLTAYLGVVTLALAYVLLYAGLRSTPSGTAVVATLLEPVTAVLLAVAFLGETLTLRAVVGCLLILLAIASLGRRAEPAAAQ